MRFFWLIAILPLLNCATVGQLPATSVLASAYSKENVDGETVHLLAIDLTQFKVLPIKAAPLATTSDLASKHHALAAMNGGFYQADGTPAALLVIDKNVLGYQSKPRAALGWSNSGDVVVDRVLYTKAHRHFVSVTGFSTPEQWEAMDFVLGGTPLLVHDYKVVESFEPEKVRENFLKYKHARTAVCIQDKRKWIFLAVEGSSVLHDKLPFLTRSGFTMRELAYFMAEHLKCKYAINLDGGGSTALVIDGTLVNQTTFGERKVSDVLGVFSR
jgi:exopolysaccharide biosynthesis protein